MKILNSETGYSLLLTLMLVLLFSILGASLMAMTINGTQKNETREKVIQSSDLADKGIELITSQITTELNQSISANGISAADYVNKLNNVVDKYKCIGGMPLTGEANPGAGTDYTVCISKSVDDLDSLLVVNSTQKYLRKNITFKSIGTSDDKSETLYTTYNIGSTQYPEVLNYAVGAYKAKSDFVDLDDPNRFPIVPSEGNLFLNGGSSIEGDLKVDGNLIVSDYGIRRTSNYWIVGYSDYSQASVFPQISAVSSGKKGKLFLGGSMYKFNAIFNGTTQNSVFNYDKHLNSTFLDKDNWYYTKVGSKYNGNLITEENLFFDKQAPLNTNKLVNVDPINFKSQLSKVHIKPNATNIYDVGDDRAFSNLDNAGDVYLVEEKCIRKCNNKNKEIELDYGGSFYGTGKNNFNKFGTRGSLVLYSTNTTFKEGAYIEENMYIKNSTEEYPSKIKGIVYVNGDLKIENAHLESDVIFYVEGDVTITESEIYGIPYDDRTGSLIIFAKGNINLSNNSVDKPNPSRIKGYFYSEQAMEIYGVGSNIRIEGGISARRITLNALRGDGKKYYSSNEQLKMSKALSRLNIIYDQDIIKNFSKLDIDTEPWINNISPPVELERSYDAP